MAGKKVLTTETGSTAASKVVRFLGSIQLAVPLMVAITIIIIGATFYESEVGATIVQHDIYKSWWFGLLMFLLATNLCVSTLSRYPWRGPRKVGFAITHFGLIVLIAGSAAVIHLSTEGMLLVRTDAAANNQIRVEGDFLEVIAPDGSRQQTDIFIRSDGSVYPSQFAGLTLASYADNAIKTVAFTDGGAVDNLAVKVSLASNRMGQTLERWMALAPAAYNDLDIGPAHLEIMQAATADELDRLLSAPAENSAPWGTLELETSQGRSLSLDLQAAVGQAQSLGDGLTVEVVEVFPDFRLGSENQPLSASEIFRNPAVQLLVSQGDARERWYVFAGGFDPVRSDDAIALAPERVSYVGPVVTASDYFRVVEGPNHDLFYAALSSKGFKSGPLAVGDSVTPGWADFEITLERAIARAQVQRSVVPVAPVAAGTMGDRGSPALKVSLEDGQEAWLPWGEPTTVSTEAGDYFFAFSPKSLKLPFSVKLNDFIVERNEGSESVAMWTSAVTLTDYHRGVQSDRRVWMNHPTWFDGWKLAQASWNPGDLQQSTLQLKREPWWVTALTWVGSLLVVGGITTMFYGPGLMKKVRKFGSPSTSDPVPASPVTEAPPEVRAGEVTEEVMSDAAA